MAIGNVLHKASKLYLTDVELTSYEGEDWIHNPDMSAVEGVPVRYWKIVLEDVYAMSQAERVALDAPELPTFKAQRKDVIRRDMLSYVNGKYDPTTFAILNSLDADALDSGLTNRAAYIDDMRDWIISLIQQQDTYGAAIDACTTWEAIEAIVWDFSSFESSDPGITPSGALAITD